MAKVTLYAQDNSEGQYYNLTFDSRETADAYNDAWEDYTAGTCYGAERMEEGCVNESAKHVYTMEDIKTALKGSDDGLYDGGDLICDMANCDECDYTFAVLETNVVGALDGNTLCDYLIINRQTGEKRWLRECATLNSMEYFCEDDWDELEIIK